MAKRQDIENLQKVDESRKLEDGTVLKPREADLKKHLVDDPAGFTVHSL